MKTRLANIPNFSKNIKISECVCVFDICSQGTNYYADYDPKTKKTYFGGRWCAVPPLKSNTQPTEDQVEEHAELFEKRTEFLYNNYLYN